MQAVDHPFTRMDGWIFEVQVVGRIVRWCLSHHGEKQTMYNAPNLSGTSCRFAQSREACDPLPASFEAVGPLWPFAARVHECMCNRLSQTALFCEHPGRGRFQGVV